MTKPTLIIDTPIDTPEDAVKALERIVLTQHEQLAEITALAARLTMRSTQQGEEMEKFKSQMRKLGEAHGAAVRMLERRVNDLRDDVKGLQRGF